MKFAITKQRITKGRIKDLARQREGRVSPIAQIFDFRCFLPCVRAIVAEIREIMQPQQKI